MSLPQVPNALIEYLDDAYPLRSPTLSMTDREIWVAVGKHELIEDLRAIHKAQQEGGDDTEQGLPNVFSERPSGAASSDTGPGRSSSTAARTPGAAGNRLGG